MKTLMPSFSLVLIAIASVCMKTAVVAQTSDPAAKDYTCVVRPKAVVELGSFEQGIIKTLMVDRGDAVEEGMVVAELDSQVQALNVALSRLKAESDVEVRSAEARIAFREAETDRVQRLFDRDVVSTRALEEASIESQLAMLALESNRLQQEIARVEYSQARELLDRRSVRSPVAGVVVELATAVGEYVFEQRHLMKIAEIDPLHIETYVPVSEYGNITVGMLGRVKMDKPIGGEYSATVTVVDRVFDPESRTFGVRLVLPNPDFALPAGMICTVTFTGDEVADRKDAVRPDIE